MNKLKYIAAILIAIAGLGLQQAKADTIFDSTINTGNQQLTNAGFFGPYGYVHIVLSADGTTATVTFTAAGSYLFGDSSAVDLNVNGPFTVSNISSNNGTFTQVAGGNADGFGTFNLRLNDTDGFGDAASVVSFTLTGSWASADQVLVFNTKGFDAAAHIFPGENLQTGFAGEGTGTVPDGGTTVMLLGVALGALGMARRFLMS